MPAKQGSSRGTGIGIAVFTLITLRYYFDVTAHASDHWLTSTLVYWSVVAVIGLLLWYGFRLLDRFVAPRKSAKKSDEPKSRTTVRSQSEKKDIKGNITPPSQGFLNVKMGSYILDVRRGLLRSWVVLSALFVLIVAYSNYTSIRDEFFDASYVYGLVIPDHHYGNENLLPVACEAAPGSEDPTFAAGYARLSLDALAQEKREDDEAWQNLGAIPVGDGHSAPIPSDAQVGDIPNIKATIMGQIAGLPPNSPRIPGFKKMWCWYRASTLRRLDPEYQETSDNRLVRTLYRKAGLDSLLIFDRSSHPWEVLFRTIGIAIGVPLAALILGYAGSWTLAGFRQDL